MPLPKCPGACGGSLMYSSYLERAGEGRWANGRWNCTCCGECGQGERWACKRCQIDECFRCRRKDGVARAQGGGAMQVVDELRKAEAQARTEEQELVQRIRKHRERVALLKVEEQAVYAEQLTLLDQQKSARHALVSFREASLDAAARHLDTSRAIASLHTPSRSTAPPAPPPTQYVEGIDMESPPALCSPVTPTTPPVHDAEKQLQQQRQNLAAVEQQEASGRPELAGDEERSRGSLEGACAEGRHDLQRQAHAEALQCCIHSEEVGRGEAEADEAQARDTLQEGLREGAARQQQQEAEEEEVRAAAKEKREAEGAEEARLLLEAEEAASAQARADEEEKARQAEAAEQEAREREREIEAEAKKHAEVEAEAEEQEKRVQAAAAAAAAAAQEARVAHGAEEVSGRQEVLSDEEEGYAAIQTAASIAFSVVEGTLRRQQAAASSSAAAAGAAEEGDEGEAYGTEDDSDGSARREDSDDDSLDDMDDGDYDSADESDMSDLPPSTQPPKPAASAVPGAPAEDPATPLSIVSPGSPATDPDDLYSDDDFSNDADDADDDSDDDF